MKIPNKKNSSWIIGFLVPKTLLAIVAYFIFASKDYFGLDMQSITLLYIGALIGILYGVLLGQSAVQRISINGIPTRALKRGSLSILMSFDMFVALLPASKYVPLFFIGAPGILLLLYGLINNLLLPIQIGILIVSMSVSVVIGFGVRMFSWYIKLPPG